MTRRTQAEWLSLFEAHQQSGLTAEVFCKEQGINPKYFSTRKKQLFNPPSPFVQVASLHATPSKCRGLTDALHWHRLVLSDE